MCRNGYLWTSSNISDITVWFLDPYPVRRPRRSDWLRCSTPNKRLSPCSYSQRPVSVVYSRGAVFVCLCVADWGSDQSDDDDAVADDAELYLYNDDQLNQERWNMSWEIDLLMGKLIDRRLTCVTTLGLRRVSNRISGIFICNLSNCILWLPNLSVMLVPNRNFSNSHRSEILTINCDAYVRIRKHS